MSALLEKIRRARETTVEAGGRTFTIRRPTDEDAIRMSRDRADMIVFVRRFVIGWDLAELDLIPGGGPEKVPFDAHLFSEWISDQPELWVPLGEAILGAYRAHVDRREASAKN